MKQVIVVLIAMLSIYNAKGQNKKEQNYIVVLHLADKYKDAKNWDDSTNARAMRHFNNLKRMMDEGTLYMAGRTTYEENDNRLFGIYIFKAESAESAKMIMNNDPAVANGIMKAEVHPFSVVLMKE